jgi:hypothetical protein
MKAWAGGGAKRGPPPRPRYRSAAGPQGQKKPGRVIPGDTR